MKENKEKLNCMAVKLFQGELTLKKMDLWLIGAVCLLTGIVYGIKKAPWTHGVMIASNNGSNNGSNNKDNNNHNKGSLGADPCEDSQEEE